MQKMILIDNQQVIIGRNELIGKWKENPGSLLWIDIEGSAEKEDEALLTETLTLPHAEVVDALRDRHPPSFSGETDFLFLLLKFLDSESQTLDFNTQQMAVFAGKGFVVTRHNRHSPYLAQLWKQVEDNERGISSSYELVALVARRMIKRYGRILLELEERLNELEDELMENLDESHMQELVSYNTSLRKMRRILKYHVLVTDQLWRYSQQKNLPEWQDEYEDIASQVERFNSLAELYQNVINDLIEGYISLNAHHLNQVMKVLTVVTVVFLPLSLLVGVYGMNFEYMPELKSQNGYFILIAVMLGIASTLTYIFRRLKWL